MGKYIINLPDDEHLISWWTYTGTEDGKQHIDFHEVVKTPYDLDAVKKEAYQRGVEDGAKSVENWNAQEKKLRIDEAYQNGLNDAWDAARKIFEYNATNLKKIFNKCCYSVIRDILGKYSASEVIEKIRQYEQEQEIKVGDEVEAREGKAVIIEVLSDGKNVRYMYSDASTGVNGSCNLTRTGRHFPEIAEVLRKMREESYG